MSKGCGYGLEDREAVARLVRELRRRSVHCWAAVLKSRLHVQYSGSGEVMSFWAPNAPLSFSIRQSPIHNLTTSPASRSRYIERGKENKSVVARLYFANYRLQFDCTALSCPTTAVPLHRASSLDHRHCPPPHTSSPPRCRNSPRPRSSNSNGRPRKSPSGHQRAGRGGAGPFGRHQRGQRTRRRAPAQRRQRRHPAVRRDRRLVEEQRWRHREPVVEREGGAGWE